MTISEAIGLFMCLWFLGSLKLVVIFMLIGVDRTDHYCKLIDKHAHKVLAYIVLTWPYLMWWHYYSHRKYSK